MKDRNQVFLHKNLHGQLIQRGPTQKKEGALQKDEPDGRPLDWMVENVDI